MVIPFETKEQFFKELKQEYGPNATIAELESKVCTPANIPINEVRFAVTFIDTSEAYWYEDTGIIYDILIDYFEKTEDIYGDEILCAFSGEMVVDAGSSGQLMLKASPIDRAVTKEEVKEYLNKILPSFISDPKRFISDEE